MLKVKRGLVKLLYLMALAFIGGGLYAAFGGDDSSIRTIILIGVCLVYWFTSEKLLQKLNLPKPESTR